MKDIFTFLKINSSAIIVFAVAIIALAFQHLDTNRNNIRRSAYEQYLREAAGTYKNLKSVKNNDQGKADSPDLASLQEYFMTMDPVEKRVTAERLSAAHARLAYMQSRKSGYTDGFQLQWTGTGAEMGGRTRAIMWDPLVNNKVWAGSVTGGLWFNNDISLASSPWQPVNDMWESLAISSITYDPNDPLTMYVGTGEAQTALITYRESSGRGVGIWKTTDGGQNWILLPSTDPFAYVTKIVVRNEIGNSVVYAGVMSGYYHGNQQSQPTDGLYRSSDGGQSWQQVLPDITGSNVPYGVSDVALGADGRIYVGTMRNLDGNGGGVVLYSDNGTSGTWTKYEDVSLFIQSDLDFPLPGRVVLATAPSNANIVYAAFASGNQLPDKEPVYECNYIFRSDDKGISWSSTGVPPPTYAGISNWAYLAWHALALAVDPNNPDVLYAGGLDQSRSFDYGYSWEPLSNWALMYSGGGNKYIHADQHVVAYKPGSSGTMLFGTDGGVFYTENGNAEYPIFKQRNKNYNTLQFYTGAIHPTTGQNKFIGGLQDNGTLLYQGLPLSIYNMISGGDGAYCFWDKETPAVYITSYYYNRYMMFNNNSQIGSAGINPTGVFINPADYYSKENTLYANATDFWGRMADSILVIDNIPSNSSEYFIDAGTNGSSYFSHVKVSPYSAGISPNLFLGTVSGKLYKVTDAISNPITTEIGSPLFPTGNISCVAVGGSEDTLLVTLSNYGVSSIWQTYNGGQSWKEVEGNLPDMPIRWAIYHPQNSKQALVATELGVWSTGNLHASTVEWTPQNTGMANVRVDMLTLRTSDNTVLAASHGRGLFTCTFNIDLNTSIPNIPEAANPFSLYVSPAGIEIQSTIKQPSEYSIYTLSGSEVITGRLPSGTLHQTINTVELSHRVYLVKVQSGNQMLVKKVVL
jgi:photosystem II stability/assembly factor-like uncharacterized protein